MGGGRVLLITLLAMPGALMGERRIPRMTCISC